MKFIPLNFTHQAPWSFRCRISPCSLIRTACFILTAILFSGCGGGGSSEVRNLPTVETVGVSGIVEDGPLKDSRVYLHWREGGDIARICGPSGAGACDTMTDDRGIFLFRVRHDADLSALEVITRGGVDTQTGVDFSAIPLGADLDFFQGNEDQVAVTPVTTLLKAEKDRLGNTQAAKDSVRQMLNLGEEQDLTAWPSNSPALQKRAILLTKLAMENNRAGHSASFETLATMLAGSSPFTADGYFDSSRVYDLPLRVEAAERLVELSQALQGNLLADWGRTFQRVELRQALVENLALMLDGELGFDLRDTQFRANVDLLAGDVLAAAQGTLIPLNDLVPQRIARFVVFSYGLNKGGRLWTPTEEFRSYISGSETAQTGPLATDPEISRLANLRTKYAITVPLLESELLDTENQRIEYYFNSDASHLYRAETLAAGINDAEGNDEIMLEIVKGKARVGLYDEAALIARSQMVQTEDKGWAYIEIARQLTSRSQYVRALEFLGLAEDCFLGVIEAKGLAFIANSDAKNLQGLAANYRRAGALDLAQKTLDKLEEAIPYLTTSAQFSRLVVGTWQLADEYLEQGDRASARPIVEDLYRYSQMTPPDEVGDIRYFRVRVFNLVETARRFARLDMPEKVLEIHSQVQALRHNDGFGNFTLNETWSFVQDLAELLFESGYGEIAFSLAQSIPDNYVDYKGQAKSATKYRLNAFKAAAVREALDHGIEAAETFIVTHFPDVHDQIEAWTYFARNKKRPYIALEAIRHEDFDNAFAALDKAYALVSRLEEPTDRDRLRYQIEWGYTKLADLAHEAGNPGLARNLLGEAEALAWSLTDLEYRISALVDIAKTYYTLDKNQTAEDLLRATLEQITGLPARDQVAMQELVLDVAKSFLQGPLADYVALARTLFTDGLPYTGTTHDDLAKLEAQSLIRAAQYYALFAGNDPVMLAEARNLLVEARSVADQLYVEQTRMDLYVHKSTSRPQIIDGYARARDYETAIELARSLPYRSERHLALKNLANTYSRWDDLPEHELASVDTDRDGLPNFFDPAAAGLKTTASEGVIDPDSDGDGIADHLDVRPLYRDTVP